MSKKLTRRLLAIFFVLVAVLSLSSCITFTYDDEESGETGASKKQSSAATQEAKESEKESSREPESSKAAAGESLEDFYAGVWQGNDSYQTTIVIRKDHTLFYSELGSPKAQSVKGVNGTWQADSKERFRLSIPGLGSGYELVGTKTTGGGYLLQCTNGQPWSDEIVKRSSLTETELKQRIKSRLAEMGEE